MLISSLQCSVHDGQAFRAQSHIYLHCCTCCCVHYLFKEQELSRNLGFVSTEAVALISFHKDQFADLLELLAFMAILVQAGHGTLQSLPSYTLACSSLPHNHVTMPGHFAVKDLYDLGDKVRDHLSRKTWHVSCFARRLAKIRRCSAETANCHNIHAVRSAHWLTPHASD